MTSLAKLLAYRKELNRRPTRYEQSLTDRLRAAGLRVKTQVIVAPFIVDILIARKMLVIEVDGGVHDGVLAKQYDQRRTIFLESLGFAVLRVRNEKVRDRCVIDQVLSYPDVLGKKSKRCAKIIDSLAAKRNRPSKTISVGGNGSF